MNSLGSNKKMTIFLMVALVLVVVFALFYYVIYPKIEEKDSLQLQLSSSQLESKQLETQLETLKSNQQAEQKSTAELKMKVPTSRELNHLINSIEQIESVSNTDVTEVAFNNYDASVKETLKTDEQEDKNKQTDQENAANSSADSAASTDTTQAKDENADSNDQNNASQTSDEQNNDEEKTAPISPIASSSLPDTLKLVTMNVTVAAMDKKEIKNFLKEIELLPRIMRIDSVSYATPNTEVTGTTDGSQEDSSKEKLQATIQLTTFYYVGQLDDQKENQKEK